MLILLSPAKSLVEGPAVTDLPATQPALLDQTEILMKSTRRLSAPKIKKLMDPRRDKFPSGKKQAVAAQSSNPMAMPSVSRPANKMNIN